MFKHLARSLACTDLQNAIVKHLNAIMRPLGPKKPNDFNDLHNDLKVYAQGVLSLHALDLATKVPRDLTVRHRRKMVKKP